VSKISVWTVFTHFTHLGS